MKMVVFKTYRFCKNNGGGTKTTASLAVFIPLPFNFGATNARGDNVETATKPVDFKMSKHNGQMVLKTLRRGKIQTRSVMLHLLKV